MKEIKNHYNAYASKFVHYILNNNCNLTIWSCAGKLF